MCVVLIVPETGVILSGSFRPGTATASCSTLWAGMPISEPGQWDFVLELWFEGVKLKAKVFQQSALPALMRELHEHLEQGPGAEAVLATVDHNSGLKTAVEGANQKPLSQRDDEDIVDAELVSDD